MDSEKIKGADGTHVHAEVGGYTVFTAPGDGAMAMHWTGLQRWTSGNVYIDNGGEHAPDEYSPAEARELAAALLRAADEAEGYADRPDAVQVGSILTAGALVAFSKSAHTSEWLRIAAFIRANVNMQGRDFPDAEAVADFLEGK